MLYRVWVTDITAHMVVSPALEGSSRVIRMFTIDLNQFVKDPARQVQVLVSKVVAQNQEDLHTQNMSVSAGMEMGPPTHLLNPVPVLVVPGDMGTISDQYIAAFYSAVSGLHLLWRFYLLSSS